MRNQGKKLCVESSQFRTSSWGTVTNSISTGIARDSAYLGHFLEGWIEAECVITDIAVITEKEEVFIRGSTTALADCALQATPALLKHSSGDAAQIPTENVETLTALGTRYDGIRAISKRTASRAHILLQHKTVVFTANYHRTRMVVLLGAGL